VSSADEAVDKGVLFARRRSSPAISSSSVRHPQQAANVAQVAGALQIAEDYAFYLQNRAIIDAVIAEPWTSMSQAQKDFYDENAAFMTRALAKARSRLKARMTISVFQLSREPRRTSL
jgi:hypothetical protein